MWLPATDRGRLPTRKRVPGSVERRFEERLAPQDFDLGIDGLWLSHRQQIGQRVLGIHLTDLGGAGADEQLRLRLVDRRHQCGRHTAHHEHGQCRQHDRRPTSPEHREVFSDAHLVFHELI